MRAIIPEHAIVITECNYVDENSSIPGHIQGQNASFDVTRRSWQVFPKGLSY